MIHGQETKLSSAIFFIAISYFVLNHFNKYCQLPFLFGLLLYERKDFIADSGDGICFSFVTFKCVQ